MTRRVRQPKSREYFEALHKAQDWHRLGVSHREIAKRLDREGYRHGRVAWSDVAVTRALDKLAAEEQLPESVIVKMFNARHDADDFITVNYPDGGEKEIGTALPAHDEDGEIDPNADERTFERFKAKVQAELAKPVTQRTYPEIQPRDWTDTSRVGWTEIGTAMTFHDGPKRAGENWGDDLVPPGGSDGRADGDQCSQGAGRHQGPCIGEAGAPDGLLRADEAPGDAD